MRKLLIAIMLLIGGFANLYALDPSYVSGAKIYVAVYVEKLLEEDEKTVQQNINLLIFNFKTRGIVDAISYLVPGTPDSYSYDEILTAVAENIVSFEKLLPGQSPYADEFLAVASSLDDVWPGTFDKTIAEMRKAGWK